MKRKAVNPSIPALLSKRALSERMKRLLTALVTILTVSLSAGADDSIALLLYQGCDLDKLIWNVDEQGFDTRKFAGLFRAEPIADTTFMRMQGKSFGDGCTTLRKDLRYLFVPHFDGHGSVRIGEMICNRAIAGDLLEIFRELFDKRYPIERMRLIDDYDGDDERSMADNNTSCFNFRRVGGSRTLSLHARGMAVDINPLYNPMVDQRKGRYKVSPAEAKPYTDRSASFPYRITSGDACCRAFRARGFSWGGFWRTKKDYQHFQRR